MLLSELARRIGGTLHGEDREITGASTIEEATGADITFLANPKYRDKVPGCGAGGIITGEVLEAALPQIVTEHPYVSFAQAVEILYPEKRHEPGVSDLAFIHPDAHVEPSATVYPFVSVGEGASVGKGCVLHPGCVIGDGASIGEGTLLYPNVVVYHRCRIGRHCILHSGVVIGSDGFGFAWDGTRHVKIPQKGIVIVGDHVEIGSNCCIDRAALTATRIGDDVKMDNLIQVGHNVVVGDHCIIVAQSGIAGSARLGKSVTLAAQAGVAGHITVGDGCVAAARAGVGQDLPPGKIVSGFPAFDHRQWLRVQQIYKDLPKLLKRVRELERRLDDLTSD
ncbi:MAG TPA: UDP-3-O-(3-hydroxymyristoyl)glucosamine N-acyltransferase [Deltaproteobacteria bacterium]|jgi:UDP-3-O-[3-hydroxymyristoyl] glucosamine N-acyltransferase|nr:UDP-3-O-(3-hydroxymyristoyl)glucosamine N-acyltransferase [Deltaproteobacteria bacterium]HOI07865.1 UDP-3-O-(3-hydroxymyristoyl)glucosamine N-acyltransferase [Deltaproteobacteria bacterium]